MGGLGIEQPKKHALYYKFYSKEQKEAKLTWTSDEFPSRGALDVISKGSSCRYLLFGLST